jgi:hypothetical protein
MRQQKWTYSPIVHAHAAAKQYEMPTDFAFWRAYNEAMLASSHGLIVLTLPGWQDSKGVTAEIEFALARKLPIDYLAAQGWGKFSWTGQF